MPIDAAKALAAEPRTGEISWNRKDVQLYHLGIGAGVPATDRRNCATRWSPGCTSCPVSPPWPAPARPG